MGINLAPDFLSPEYLAAWDAVMAPAHGADAATRQKLREAAGPQLRAIPLPGLDWIARHVRHAINIGGEACIGLGGDLDGISFMPAGIDGVEELSAHPGGARRGRPDRGSDRKGLLAEHGAGVWGSVGVAGNWKLETGNWNCALEAWRFDGTDVAGTG